MDDEIREPEELDMDEEKKSLGNLEDDDVESLDALEKEELDEEEEEDEEETEM